jgi:hypothetical protein
MKKPEQIILPSFWHSILWLYSQIESEVKVGSSYRVDE